MKITIIMIMTIIMKKNKIMVILMSKNLRSFLIEKDVFSLSLSLSLSEEINQ
jgi:hypothetical protein